MIIVEKQGEEIKIETVKLQNLNDFLKETKVDKEALLLVNTKEKDSIHIEKKLLVKAW